MSPKKLNLKDKYKLLTRDLDWEFSYEDRKEAFPYEEFEGIKITDWDKWEDPFRLTMESYWKYQAEKEKKLYAIYDAFAQNNGQTNVTDARYVNAIKLFLTGVSPGEHAAHLGFAFTGRQMGGIGARVAAQMQSIDELRHIQTQIHAMSHYNKFFDGFDEFNHMHDRLWYLSVPKSFFEDARTAGPFEFMIAIGFSFEYVLTNLLFVPFMSGAAYNGDMATVTFGFSAQSDEARHMTLGLEIIKFILEQHEDNLPIVQKWLDKWLWRGYRLLTLVAMMMDYMLPQKVMSWQEAWELYFEDAGGSLLKTWSATVSKCPTIPRPSNKKKNTSAIRHGGFSTNTHMLPHSTPGHPVQKRWIGSVRSILRLSISTTDRAGSSLQKWKLKESDSIPLDSPNFVRLVKYPWHLRKRVIPLK